MSAVNLDDGLTLPQAPNTERAFLVAGVQDIRRHFPALARRHKGHPVAYFDGPGGTQVPTTVADAVADYLLHHNANRHWAYPTSIETDEAILEARRALADWIGGSPEEIVFGANMTTLTFHLGRALGRKWGAGDVVVVTELDHHANSDTWRALAQERGVAVRAGCAAYSTADEVDRLVEGVRRLEPPGWRVSGEPEGGRDVSVRGSQAP